MTGMEDSEDTNVGNTKPQVGRFVFLVGPSAIVMASDRILTVSNITLDPTKKTRNSTIDGNIRHFDNEISRTGLANLENTEIGDIKHQLRRFIFLDGSGVIVLATRRFLTASFSLNILVCTSQLFWWIGSPKEMSFRSTS